MKQIDMDLIDRIHELRNLESNWDSYGAMPIPNDTINEAIEIAKHLPTDRHWSVVPTHGGIQLESHDLGFDIEIDIEKV